MIGIITINDYVNYGNRLQNYAVYRVLSQYDTTYNIERFYFAERTDQKHLASREIEEAYRPVIDRWKYYGCLLDTEGIQTDFADNERLRKERFLEFNSLIQYGERITCETDYMSLNSKYDFFVAGSDQVFNPTFPGNGMYVNMLGFADREKRIAFSPSIGINPVPEENEEEFRTYLKDFRSLSCREKQGAEYIGKITGRKCEWLADPTLMIDKEEWHDISRKPETELTEEKYILLYFLGYLTEEYRDLVLRIADKYGYEIINLKDPQSPFYSSGPREFIYLIEHAALVLTDSFHGAIFSYLFNRPFRVFKRNEDLADMSCRMTSLVEKLHLNEDIYFSGQSDINNVLKTDYDYTVLDSEREKVRSYLEKALEAK